jgi:hypothetical protein
MPQAEGGFVKNIGSGKLAVQLGRQNDFDREIREINGQITDMANNVVGGKTFGEGQNNLDLMYAGGGPNQHWGAGMALTRSKTSAGNQGQVTSVQSYDFRAGLQSDRWEAFGSILLGAQSETDQPSGSGTLNESFGIRAGGGFQINSEIRAYAHASYDKFTANLSSAPNYTGTRYSILGGTAYVRKLDETSRIFASVELNYLSDDATESNGAPEELYKYMSVPLAFGIEADANSWARLRTSVRQNVLIGFKRTTVGNTPNDSQYWENSPNNTAVAFGAGAVVNHFNFDVALVQPLNVTTTDNPHADLSLTYLF